MRDVSFGQYYPTNSVLHRMDARTKLIGLIVYIVCLFLAKSFWGLLLGFVAFLICLCLSGVPAKKVFGTVKGIGFLLIFTAVANLFFHTDGEVLFEKWIFKITKEGVYFTVFFTARLLLLVTASSILTLTTTPVAFTDGIESLLFPLKLVHFPVHELALIMSIALRFIPILSDETNRIMNAQKARGADFETGGLFKRVRALIPVLVPLLVSAFRRADELGDAMDARCYSGSKVRTKYKKLKFALRDYSAFLFLAVLIAGTVLCRIYFLPVI